VAIKVLLPRLVSDPVAMREMKREVRLCQCLSHPNIVSVFDYRVHERTPYIVMELVAGQTLTHFVFSKPGNRLCPSDFEPIAQQILDAVEHAHENGVVHRDLKPANIMIRPDGWVKVMDFGIAATVKATYTRLTALTSALTVQYSSPEQINGEAPAPSMDIYSLGCVFYELLCGHPPFFRGEIVHQQLTATPPPPEGVPEVLSLAILSCLEKDPGKRPRSIAELRARLAGNKTVPVVRVAGTAAQESRRSIRAPRKRWFPMIAFPAAALVIFVLAGGVWSWQAERKSQEVRLASVQGQIDSSLAAEDWSAAEQKMNILSELAPESPVLDGYRRQIKAGKRLEKREALARAVAGSISRKDWAAAGALLGEFSTMANGDARVAEWRSRIEDGQALENETEKLRTSAIRQMQHENWSAADRSIGRWERLDPNDPDLARYQALIQQRRLGNLLAAEAKRRRKRIAELETTVTGHLEQRQWDLAEKAIAKLKQFAPDKADTETYKEKIAAGRAADQQLATQQQEATEIERWSAAVEDALEKKNWDQAEAAVRKLETVTPLERQVERWMRRIREGRTADQNAAEKAARESRKRAAALLRQARAKREQQSRIEFVQIKPGTFERRHGKKRFTVRITQPFEISIYEITQAQWAAVMDTNPSHFKAPNHPVENVSWHGARKFLARLNEKGDGYRYDLPTEAQWEYAARAGSLSFPVSVDDAQAWYADNSGSTTKPVGLKKPNGWGIYDMLGNVEEWCRDYYDEQYYRTAPMNDPAGPDGGAFVVVRGGSWSDYPRIVRYDRRNRASKNDQASYLGFRCVRTIE